MVRGWQSFDPGVIIRGLYKRIRDMPIKIALVARNIPPSYGGGGMLARTIAMELGSRGYDVEILTDTPSPEPVEYCRVRSPYTNKPLGTPVGRLLRRFTEYIWLRSRIRDGGYQLVYGVSAAPFVLTAIYLAKRYHIANAFETSLLGNDDYLTINGRISGPLWGRVFRMADRIVNISPALEKSCIDGGVDKSKLTLIPNPVSSGQFFPLTEDNRRKLRHEKGLSDSTFVLFSAGAVSRRKGTDRIISAFISFCAKEKDAVLILAGPEGKTSEEIRYCRQLKKQLIEAGLESKVNWLGQIDDVAIWMQLSDVFVFGSRREGFGTVFTEAMAVGLPVVAYKIDGITDYIFGVRCGENIVDSERDFVESLNVMFESAELRSQVGDKLYSRFRTMFSTERVMSMYEKLFKEQIERRC